MMESWRRAGEPNRDGLVPVEGTGEARLAAELRGGVAWPWPVAVGARLVAAGAVVAVGWVPAEGRARLLWWRLAGTVGPVHGPDGWPLDGGVAGALREAALGLGCWRYYALIPPGGGEAHTESLRTVRRLLRDLAGLRVTAFADQAAVDDTRAILFRWASERRLVQMPEEALAVIEAEEGEPAGPRPLTSAVAAALESLDRRPWRPARLERWEPIPRDILGAGAPGGG